MLAADVVNCLRNGQKRTDSSSWTPLAAAAAAHDLLKTGKTAHNNDEETGRPTGVNQDQNRTSMYLIKFDKKNYLILFILCNRTRVLLTNKTCFPFCVGRS